MISDNKEQLVKLFCDSNNGFPTLHLIRKQQPRSNHEEAGVSIISYLLLLYKQKNHIQFVADDTNIFILHDVFVWKPKIVIQMLMKNMTGE